MPAALRASPMPRRLLLDGRSPARRTLLRHSTVQRRDGSVAPLNKLRGFIEIERKAPAPYRPAADRLADYAEINGPADQAELTRQSARCMDCGTPFCHTHTGCPISNVIPEFNQQVFDGEWRQAYSNLASTNNFPEFTGRVCPAPCEGACVAGLVDESVTIKSMEYSIIERAWSEGWVVAAPPARRSGKKVAVVGSGPAGLAAADELNKKYGHAVTVFERAERAGGLLTYGIPNMKLDKETVQRRVDLMEAEGISFVTGAEVDAAAISETVEGFDATVLAIGSTVPNNLPIPGRDLDGIVYAMEFLTRNQKALFANPPALLTTEVTPEVGLTSKYGGGFISAKGKHVVVIGGGDTGTDCIGTSLRHGCKSLINFELFPAPPDEQDKRGEASGNPWPLWPRIMRVDYGHEEASHRFGADPRTYSVLSKEFVSDGAGRVRAVKTVQVEVGPDGRFAEVEGSEREHPADLVILAMGFRHPEQEIVRALRLETDQRSNAKASTSDYKTSAPGVFAAGDCRRGQSLVVWAINEGRGVAKSVDAYLGGKGW
mmetsp:Transcript_813/g.2774  ORF Transcript_813/g.2774 Transcript_813/m.2774 type:complete len:545 (+) Transcript_813:100-1734(+)